MDERVRFARRLRLDQTRAERRFWRQLQPWRDSGWHFRRQAPIGPFVVDFVCKRIGLVFEIDGDSHHTDAGIAYDARRTAVLGQMGYRVIRFSNGAVLEGDDGMWVVLRGILGEPEGFG